MGPVRAVFKANGDETHKRYSISEWWLEPYTRGPGAHTHDEDDVFFVIAGTMSFHVDGAWLDAPAGSVVIAPGGTPHDFESRTAELAGALNASVPGNFEPHMPGIAAWFRARSSPGPAVPLRGFQPSPARPFTTKPSGACQDTRAPCPCTPRREAHRDHATAVRHESNVRASERSSRLPAAPMTTIWERGARGPHSACVDRLTRLPTTWSTNGRSGSSEV